MVTEKSEPVDGYLVKDLCNDFRTAKLNQKNAGELSARMYEEYALMCDLVVAQFGKERRADRLQPEDFAALRETMVKRWGPLRVLNGVTRVKTIFKFAYDALARIAEGTERHVTLGMHDTTNTPGRALFIINR